MDIHSGYQGPAGELSNFARHSFTIDGIECASMEGFLQSLKFKNPEKQLQVCKLTGWKAKNAGAKQYWQITGKLYWQGKSFDRLSEEYQTLLSRAYDALFANPEFRKALLATKNEGLTHNIGKKNPSETILTQQEFIFQLYRLRTKLFLNK